MSRRAVGSSSSAMSRAEQIASGRLRMDRNPAHARITDPSLAAGRRKEIDNVMKRARASSPGSWDRKLLEVEEKDPNRWRHTGYKQMYLEDGADRSGSLSPRSPRRRSPPLVSTTTPYRSSGRDNGAPASSYRSRADQSSQSQAVVSSSRDNRDRERDGRDARDNPRDARETRDSRDDRDRERHRDRDARPNRAPPPRGRPPSPPPRRVGRSPSASSLSSCSDDSCSVCSLKQPKQSQNRSRSRSFSVPRSSGRVVPPQAAQCRPPAQSNSSTAPPHQHQQSLTGAQGSSARRLTKPLNSGNANAGPSTLSLRRTAASSSAGPPRINVHTTKKPKPATPAVAVPSSSRDPIDGAKKRSRDEKVLEWQRTQLTGVHKGRRPPDVNKTDPVPPPTTVVQKEKPPHKLKIRIKKEGERPKKSKTDAARKGPTAPQGEAVSPETIAAALANESSGEYDSSSEEDSLLPQHQPDNRLTLSERFGKMAQWSADRSNGMENMRITRGAAGDGGGGALTVRIQETVPSQHDIDMGTGFDEPPLRYAHSPAPEGHYPDELLTAAPVGLPSWDDVRVRYDYYKKRGYLRGLSLSDYVKWEEWWYRYQQWLKQERNYERYMRGGRGGGYRKRRGGPPHHSSAPVN